jgi:hypothetical protein
MAVRPAGGWSSASPSNTLLDPPDPYVPEGGGRWWRSEWVGVEEGSEGRTARHGSEKERDEKKRG